MKILREHLWRYFLYSQLSILAAGGSMGIAYLISSVINDYFSGPGNGSGKYTYLFLISLLVFFICRWLVSSGIIRFTQELLKQTKLDILHMVLRSPYYTLISKKERIYTAMTRDAGNIAQASVSVVDIVTNSFIGLICFIYMGILAWKLLLALFVLLALTVLLYSFTAKRQHALFLNAMSYEDHFIRYLNEILHGFKEIVIEREKGFSIEQRKMLASMDESVELNRKAYILNLNNRIIGQMAFYVFIGVILLFLGKAFGVSNKVSINFVFLVLYVFGPIETVVVLLPGLSRARASVKKLQALLDGLQTMETETDDPTNEYLLKKLNANNICYDYKDEKTGEVLFSIGPVDFQVSVGEVVFIFGGNGSGKTTFINLLIGLFTGGTGDILVNDIKIENAQSPAYRRLFAPVFSDFHLFDECYGMGQVDVKKAERYLKLFELDGKISFEGNKFSSIDLSTGQKKRLALIYAMLEGKPILVLDEFAADQDPYFRKKFYLEILDIIRKEGFTVIAVTHDDSYYRYCDKLYKMESGKLDLITAPQSDLTLAQSYSVIQL